jgi:hypothetical protein
MNDERTGSFFTRNNTALRNRFEGQTLVDMRQTSTWYMQDPAKVVSYRFGVVMIHL